MRLTHVLNRCAVLLRAAARRVGQSLGLLGRAVLDTVRPTVRAVGRQLRDLATIALPVGAMACGHHDAATPSSAIAGSTSSIVAAAQRAAVPPAPAPSAEPATETVPAAAAAAPAPAPAPGDEVDLEKPLGDFYMTFYYVAVEDEISPRPARAPAPASAPSLAAGAPPAVADAVRAVDLASMAPITAPPAPRETLAAHDTLAAANDNAVTEVGDSGGDDVTLAASAGPALEPMIGQDCSTLAEVSPAFAAQVRMQGTGRLRDGRLINVAGACACGGSCFHIHPPSIKWGRGSSGLPLAPFRMVAVDTRVIPMGSLLYIPELDGMRMPGRAPTGGYIHDGCVVAADVGGAIKGRQLDMFVGRRAYYDGLARRGSSHGWATSVEVWDGSKRCTRRGSKVSRSAAASI